MGSPTDKVKIINNDDVLNEMRVFTYSIIRKRKRVGHVKAKRTTKKVKINNKLVTFKNVIPVSKISWKGDSGAAVVDEYGDVLGILFASNNKTTYIIPISEINNHFKITINDA